MKRLALLVILIIAVAAGFLVFGKGALKPKAVMLESTPEETVEAVNSALKSLGSEGRITGLKKSEIINTYYEAQFSDDMRGMELNFPVTSDTGAVKRVIFISTASTETARKNSCEMMKALMTAFNPELAGKKAEAKLKELTGDGDSIVQSKEMTMGENTYQFNALSIIGLSLEIYKAE